jgi:hypothetical protein
VIANYCTRAIVPPSLNYVNSFISSIVSVSVFNIFEQWRDNVGRRFIICTAHPLLLGNWNPRNHDGMAM